MAPLLTLAYSRPGNNSSPTGRLRIWPKTYCQSQFVDFSKLMQYITYNCDIHCTHILIANKKMMIYKCNQFFYLHILLLHTTHYLTDPNYGKESNENWYGKEPNISASIKAKGWLNFLLISKSNSFNLILGVNGILLI